MKDFGHVTIIRKLKINNLSHGATINYGSALHIGHQANVKINTNEIAIGDEYSFAAPEDSTEMEENSEDSSMNDSENGQENRVKIKPFRRKRK